MQPVISPRWTVSTFSRKDRFVRFSGTVRTVRAARIASRPCPGRRILRRCALTSAEITRFVCRARSWNRSNLASRKTVWTASPPRYPACNRCPPGWGCRNATSGPLSSCQSASLPVTFCGGHFPAWWTWLLENRDLFFQELHFRRGRYSVTNLLSFHGLNFDLRVEILTKKLKFYKQKHSWAWASSSELILPHRQIKYPVDFDDELKTRKRQIR